MVSGTFTQQYEDTLRDNQRLRAGIEAIKRATVAGKVCDDVAWFDEITTLYDYCDLLLNPGFGNEQFSEGSKK